MKCITIKKKIIKKIIKRRNADGTEAPPEVITTIVEREVETGATRSSIKTS